MASGPIIEWQIEGGNVEAVTDFLFLGSKITADGDYSHEMRRRLLLGRKARTDLDSVLKGRDITLPTKVHIVKAKVSPRVTYSCESWTLKKAEHQRIDVFELWSRRRSPSYLFGNPFQAPQLEKTHDTPPSSRDEGLFPAWHGEQNRVLSPDSTGGLTLFRPLSWLQEIPVRT